MMAQKYEIDCNYASGVAYIYFNYAKMGVLWTYSCRYAKKVYICVMVKISFYNHGTRYQVDRDIAEAFSITDSVTVVNDHLVAVVMKIQWDRTNKT